MKYCRSSSIQKTARGYFPPPGMCEGNNPKLSVAVTGTSWLSEPVSRSRPQLSKHPRAWRNGCIPVSFIMKQKCVQKPSACLICAARAQVGSRAVFQVIYVAEICRFSTGYVRVEAGGVGNRGRGEECEKRVRTRGQPPPHMCRSVSAVRIRRPSRCPANRRPLPQKDSAMSQAIHHWGWGLRPGPLKHPRQKIVFLCSSHPAFQKNSYSPWGEMNPDQRFVKNHQNQKYTFIYLL